MSEGKEGRARAAFSAHMRGIEPPEVELATAPVLDRWEAVVGGKEGERVLFLKGDVTGHPTLGNERISTTPVIWLDRKHRWARTISRVYRLEGRMIDDEPLELDNG